MQVINISAVKARLPIAASLAVAVLVAGCGSSKPSGPTKAEYVAKADAICNAAKARTEPLVKELTTAGARLATGGPSFAREVAPVVQHLREEAEASLKKLRALKRPKGESAAIERLLTPLGSVVAAAGQAEADLKAGQGAQALALLAQVQPDAEAASKAAKAYGVAPCGEVLAVLG